MGFFFRLNRILLSHASEQLIHLTILLVCLGINLTVEKQNKDMQNVSHRWELGSCEGSLSYEMNFTYVKYERCCLIPGYHTLTCHNEKGPFGWGNSSLEINGQRYCNDFVGFKAMRRVLIDMRCKKLTCTVISVLCYTYHRLRNDTPYNLIIYLLLKPHKIINL